jgi:predicted O-methyltransferase YrrM
VVGVDLHLERQREFLDGVIARFANECEFPDAPTELSSQYHYNNGLFEAVDAEIAYSMVRWLRPRCIVEIGSGYSTRVMASALVRNFEKYANDCHFVSIEPNPDAVLSRGFTGLTRVVPKRVQDAELDIPSMLNAGDILFIDSSHVVAVGSDVVYEFLEVLPRLRSGVVVHVHDIFLPADYPRDTVLDGLCFWSEQYLLQAFLSFNRDYEVLWSSSAMQSAYPAELARVFPRWEGSYERMPEAKRQFIPTLD